MGARERTATATTTITPFLWFDDNLSEALDFYSAIVPDANVHGEQRGSDGTLFGAEFELAGQSFNALNGGPQHRFTEAISMFVECDGQAEVDRYWEALVDGGEESQCGWLKDRFGLSWQIIPRQFGELLGTGTPEQAQRVIAAMQKMDVAALRSAYDG